MRDFFSTAVDVIFVVAWTITTVAVAVISVKIAYNLIVFGNAGVI